LFLSFAKAFGVAIEEVVIYKLEEGVFYAQCLCDNGRERVTLDARTSDAIALALRFRCPIYTTEEIISKAGIVLDFDKEQSRSAAEKDSAPAEAVQSNTEFSSLESEELKRMLEEAVAREDYERASRIRDEIKRRE